MPMPANSSGFDGLSPQQVGKVGERLARNHLEAKGYSIVATNYRCRWGEVDVVARDGPIWVFVEVRTRRGDAYGAPEESLTPEKAQRLMLTAQHFFGELQDGSAEADWRIDLVAIRLGPARRVLDIHHLENVVAG